MATQFKLKNKKDFDFGQEFNYRKKFHYSKRFDYSKGKRKKVDPDAPGTPGEPGYEPPVRREDLDAEGKKLYDSKRNAKKHPLGIEDPAELEKLYKTTEKPRQ